MIESSGIQHTPCQMNLRVFWAAKNVTWTSSKALDCHGKLLIDSVRQRKLNTDALGSCYIRFVAGRIAIIGCSTDNLNRLGHVPHI